MKKVFRLSPDLRTRLDDLLDLVVDGEQALLPAAIAPVDVCELGIG